jgi:squalene synthase HpnC
VSCRYDWVVTHTCYSLAVVPSDGEIMARAGGENFPVAPLVLPRSARRHLMAVYGFARLVDDIGDDSPGDRLALLVGIDEEIDRLYSGTPEHPVIERLAATVREMELPLEPFRQLVEANRRDQLVHRYDTIDALLEYCSLSANPVGRLVLEILGAATPERLRWSDSVCTGLQIAEHIQDVSEDLERGRVYLPQEDLFWFGCAEEDLRSGPFGPEARALFAFEVDRVRSLLEEGVPLVGSLGGRLRLGVAAYVAGGQAALDGVERGLRSPVRAPARPRRRDVARHLGRVLGASVRRSGRPSTVGVGAGR